MPLALSPNASAADITSSINYLMATLGQGFNSVTVSQATGQVTSPYNQNSLGWSYQYINIRYSTSSDGTANFSTVPTNATYYGLRNTATTAASNNPVDYVWYEVAGGFGTNKFLFYSAIGGRQIVWIIDTVVPNDNYQPTYDGVAVDLDIPTLVNTAIISNTANSAITAITVINSAQPNITSVGTMISLTSVGNIRGNSIIGNGFFFPNGVSAINDYSNANVANYIPTDPYIISLTGNVTTLQGNIVTLTTDLANTNSNVANLQANSYANSNVASYLSNTTITISTTGNIAANYFIGDGSLITNINAGNIVGGYGNSNVANYIPTDPYIISLTGNVTTLQGNIITLTDAIANTNSNVANNAANIASLTGNVYANANVANYLSNTTITISTTGNVAANYYIGNGSLLTNISAANIIGAYGNANVANYIPTDPYIISLTGNVTTLQGNVVTLQGNIITLTTGLANTDSNVANNTANITTLQGNVVTLTNAVANNTANITSLTGNVYANANASAYFANATTNISTTGAIAGANVTAVSRFFLPSLTQTQINALTPVAGEMVYNSTLQKIQGYQTDALGTFGWVSFSVSTYQ